MVRYYYYSYYGTICVRSARPPVAFIVRAISTRPLARTISSAVDDARYRGLTAVRSRGKQATLLTVMCGKCCAGRDAYMSGALLIMRFFGRYGMVGRWVTYFVTHYGGGGWDID